MTKAAVGNDSSSDRCRSMKDKITNLLENTTEEHFYDLSMDRLFKTRNKNKLQRKSLQTQLS